MKIIFGLFSLFYSAHSFSKSLGLNYNINGFYSLQYQVMPKKTVGVLYNSISLNEDSYKYEGSNYGLSLSSQDFSDDMSYDLFLSRIAIVRFQCATCKNENLVNYIWGFSVQKNWVWEWGLHIYFGVGFRYQYKNYDYRGPSFLGPQLYSPIGIGFAF